VRFALRAGSVSPHVYKDYTYYIAELNMTHACCVRGVVLPVWKKQQESRRKDATDFAGLNDGAPCGPTDVPEPQIPGEH